MRRVVTLLLGAICGAGVCSAENPVPKIRIEPLVQGLQNPLYLTHDGTERIFIVEQVGRIRLFEDGLLQKVPYLDITSRVLSGGECGLLGLAFHPKFSENGYLYVNYTSRRGRITTIISEFRADPKSSRVDPSSERIILTFPQPYSNHNGGQLEFGPDGMLYIGTGDGGSAGDPHNNGQKTSSLLGKILRINVNTRSGYTIPPDNPFVKRSGYRAEVWALGLRNPWRFSFDRETGICYCADVGQNLWEEIDIIEKGGNYGWRFREGAHPFSRDRNPPADLIDPIKEYHHDLGLSITGGYVYRGKSIPSLVGWYIYGDYSSGRIWGLKYENSKLTADAQMLHSRTQPASFGEGVAGELYLCDHNGTVYRIEDGS